MARSTAIARNITTKDRFSPVVMSGMDMYVYSDAVLTAIRPLVCGVRRDKGAKTAFDSSWSYASLFLDILANDGLHDAVSR